MDYTILDLLVQLVEHGASDIHLTAGVPPTLRVHGKLMRLDYKPLSPEDVKTLAYSMIREDQRKKYELERELDFGYSQKGIGRFRCNVGFQRESTLGENFVTAGLGWRNEVAGADLAFRQNIDNTDDRYVAISASGYW